MQEVTEKYEYRYSWLDRVRLWVAALFLGNRNGLWGSVRFDLKCILVKEYLAGNED